MTFYFLRGLTIFGISFILFKPKFTGLKTKLKLQILAVGILWVIYRVIVYYGYINFGVIFTT